jgi:glycosyltransferase involved in cell wall biosynthesis
VAPERIEIVHNSIQPDWGRKAREPKTAAAFKAQLGIPPQRKVILIVGRLSREKDHLTLLEAVKRLGSADPHLIIVGEGPERPRIENQVRLLDLAERVTFTGQQNSAEPYYGIADVAVLSSLSEGSPNALLEAMASGVPVVATSVGGIPEIVSDNESALLVRPGDVAGMSAAMERLLINQDLAGRLMERSRELIRLRHAPEARMRKLGEIYESCLAGIRVGQGKNN